jgi:hypothetical protein
MPAVDAHCVGVVLITQHAVACASLFIFICQKARAKPRCPRFREGKAIKNARG